MSSRVAVWKQGKVFDMSRYVKSATYPVLILFVSGSLVHQAWHVIPPGAFIAILGFLAAILAFFDPPKTGPKKALWVAFFFSLMVGEILVLRREARIGEEHFSFIATRFDEQSKTLTALQANNAALVAMNSPKPLIPEKHSPSTSAIVPSLPLKLRAIELSTQLLNFLAGRQITGPPIPRPQTWEDDVKIAGRYDHETVDLYKQMYLPRVGQIRDELAKQGLKDERLDLVYKDPHNVTGIIIIADAIGSPMGGLAYRAHN